MARIGENSWLCQLTQAEQLRAIPTAVPRTAHRQRRWPFPEATRRDALEILEDRHGRRATLITSQLPAEHLHEIIGDPTPGDAILDRLAHTTFKINLKWGTPAQMQIQVDAHTGLKVTI